MGWVVLMLIGTNLLGFFSLGLMRVSVKISLFVIVLFLIYIFLLFHFLNIGVVIAATMLIVSRIPDLIWENRHGQQISRKNMPKGPIYTLTTIIQWSSLLVLWWSLYSLQKAN